MQTIRLVTWVNAPVERCFKLSLSVDLHVLSARSTGERIVAGVGTGLMGLNQTVTWSAKHFGRQFQHTSLLDAWRPFSYFRDVMVEGAFETFVHEHHFAVMNDGTRIRDEVRFSAPMGPLGLVAEKLVLRRHLIRLLKRRNSVIKQVAESEMWNRFVGDTTLMEGDPYDSGASDSGMKKLVASPNTR
jgi:ligand-binding SRPBCC domain-containing protein